jgi:hypothetical protein
MILINYFSDDPAYQAMFELTQPGFLRYVQSIVLLYCAMS